MWLSDLTVVLPDQVLPRASIQIEAGTIANIIEGPAPAPAMLNGRGLVALPGLVDLHGDMIERELEPRPNSRLSHPLAIFELDKRLATAGITTAYAALSFATFQLPVGDDTSKRPHLRNEDVARAVTLSLNSLRPHLLTDLRVHARFEVNYRRAAPILTELIEAEQVHMVSLMDHTPGQGQYRDVETYLRTMSAWYRVEEAAVARALDVLLAEAEDLAASTTLREVSALCHEHGIVLASHDDDTAAKVTLMAGLRAILCEFPVTVEAALAARRQGMYVAMGAPNALRGTSHNGNVSAREILDAGALDILLTDYHPASMLHAAFGWVKEGLITLPQASALIATNPAACVGLQDRGTLAVGKRADLVLVKPLPWLRVAATLCAGRFIFRSHFPGLCWADD